MKKSTRKEPSPFLFTCCGYTNPLTIENIYDSEEDYQEGGPPTDAKKFFRALKERTEELEDE